MATEPPAPRTPGAGPASPEGGSPLPGAAPGGGSPLLAALAGQRARYAARGMGATDWAGRLAGISAVSAQCGGLEGGRARDAAGRGPGGRLERAPG